MSPFLKNLTKSTVPSFHDICHNWYSKKNIVHISGGEEGGCFGEVGLSPSKCIFLTLPKVINKEQQPKTAQNSWKQRSSSRSTSIKFLNPGIAHPIKFGHLRSTFPLMSNDVPDVNTMFFFWKKIKLSAWKLHTILLKYPYHKHVKKK